MARSTIGLLTDFGLRDHYVGTMKGVILRISPDAQLVDISHEIASFAIGEAAFTLAQAAPWFPRGSVHLVVVDPGVGSSRRAIAAAAAGQFFVAPDNGVLTMAMSADPAAMVHEIANPAYFLKPVSRTFHGRDVFAPVAAHLANGVSLDEFGPRIDDFVKLASLLAEELAEGEWAGCVLKIDRFGNIVTNLRIGLADGQFELLAGEVRVTRLVGSYTDGNVREPFAIRGSAGYLEISLNQGDASRELNVRPGDGIRLKIK